MGRRELDTGWQEENSFPFFKLASNSSTHNVRVEGLHIDVPDGAAGEGPHLGFMFESSSDLKKDVNGDNAIQFWAQVQIHLFHSLTLRPDN